MIQNVREPLALIQPRFQKSWDAVYNVTECDDLQTTQTRI